MRPETTHARRKPDFLGIAVCAGLLFMLVTQSLGYSEQAAYVFAISTPVVWALLALSVKWGGVRGRVG
ncbi:hypothetical protein AAII07_01985 [Microvirga sp. 0TCS3.31]